MQSTEYGILSTENLPCFSFPPSPFRLPPFLLTLGPWRFNPCPDPCCQPCEACKDNRYPDELTLTLAGLQDSYGCHDCSRANGSWVVQRQTPCTPVAWGPVWQSTVNYGAAFPDVPMCVCGAGRQRFQLSLRIYWNSGGTPGRRRISAAVGNSLACLSVTFLLDQPGQSGPLDCQHLDNLVLPYSGYGAAAPHHREQRAC